MKAATTALPDPPATTRRSALMFSLVAAVAGTAGWLAGRRLGRGSRDASLGLSAPLPARGRLAIDGRAIAPPEPGKKIPVEPGRHSISITTPKKDGAQTFDIVVGPGEHVVLLVPPGGGGGGANRRVERRAGDTGGEPE